MLIFEYISINKSHKQLTNEVTGLFEDFLEYYTHTYDFEDNSIIKFIKNRGGIHQKVLEVGGNNGNVIDNIFKYTPIEEGYNLELTPIFSKYQVNDNIVFINGSALNLPFKDGSFDVVVIRLLLHHLVGSSITGSITNAQRVVDELIRVTRNGGYILIEDIYNKYKIYSSITFYILLILSKLNLSSRFFLIHKNLIVLFLTIKEIRSLLNKENVEIVEEEIREPHQPLKFKVTVLLSKTGRIFLAGLKGDDKD